MLPLVGSTITPPGFSRPARSAASIIGSAMRSFTEPPGFMCSSLATMRGAHVGGEAIERDEWRAADGGGDVGQDAPVGQPALGSGRRLRRVGHVRVARPAAGSSACPSRGGAG